MNLEDSWMYEDGQDEVVFSVDSTCQLLGVGLCGTDAAYTAELEVLEVDPEDFSIEVSQCVVKFVCMSATILSFVAAAPTVCSQSINQPISCCWTVVSNVYQPPMTCHAAVAWPLQHTHA